jgi:hypothetical protein
MTIREQLAAELRDAMKSGDTRRRDVIRQVESELAIARSAPGFSGQVDDDLYRNVIASYVRKMDKARIEYEGFGERGRPMAEKLAFEVEYLGRYLPRKLDEAATRTLAEQAIAELGVAGDAKAAGRVVGHLMKTHRDELEGGVVNRIVRELLGAG